MEVILVILALLFGAKALERRQILGPPPPDSEPKPPPSPESEPEPEPSAIADAVDVGADDSLDVFLAAPLEQRALKRAPTTKKRVTHRLRTRGSETGWLGVLVAHGMLCQGQIYDYMRKRGHISWDKHLSNGTHGGYLTKNRFAYKFNEFPPPVNISIDFLSYKGAGNPRPWVFWSKHNFYEWLDEKKPIAEMYRHNTARYFAKATDRYDWLRWGLAKKNTAKGIIKVSEGWTTEEYRKHWTRYYLNARWLIWAAEMMRCHSKLILTPAVVPFGWGERCTSWGIGCAGLERWTSRSHKLNKRMVTPYEAEYDWLNIDYVAHVLRQVMREIPAPGAIPSGEEIRRPRRLADWAPNADRCAPPIGWPNQAWAELIKNVAMKKQLDDPGYKVASAFVKIGVSVVAAYGGGAAVAVIGGVLGALVDAGIGALLSMGSQLFAAGKTLSGRDFGQLAIDIAQGTMSGQGFTKKEALANWENALRSLDDSYPNGDDWPFADELAGGITPNSYLKDKLEDLL